MTKTSPRERYKVKEKTNHNTSVFYEMLGSVKLVRCSVVRHPPVLKSVIYFNAIYFKIRHMVTLNFNLCSNFLVYQVMECSDNSGWMHRSDLEVSRAEF